MGLDIDIYRTNVALIPSEVKQYNEKYTGYDKPTNKDDLKIFYIIESAETIGYLKGDVEFLRLVETQIGDGVLDGKYLLLSKYDCEQIYNKSNDGIRNVILNDMVNSDNNTILFYYSC